ncbi:MAG: potassium-transporting ATPase subunit KdpC [Desulfobulbaceae bacterium]|nr:potassium-transporting ATPase subunit KdpC [Desulfobulbaceae bacterium]
MKDLKTACLLFILLTVLLGGAYPAVVTATANLLFPHQAQGSFVMDKNGKVAGSLLIGQPFTEDKYFWPRPSATADFGYNPLASGGSNLGPTNQELIQQVKERITTLRVAGINGEIPNDLVLASASGLDPHISPFAAESQIPHVAKARGLSEEVVKKLVSVSTEERQLGFLGEPRVNVLALNLKLDRIVP